MNKKILITIIIVSTLVLAAFIFKGRFNLLGDCGSKMAKEFLSDNNRIKIEASIWDCGATTDYSTHLSLIDIDTHSSNKIVVLKGDHSSDLNVIWLNSEKVSIEFKGSMEDVFNLKNKINKIEFEIRVLK